MSEVAKRPKVVIIGAGFGGLALAKSLKHAPVDIEIIDKRNYHLFQPLLYQVAMADLSPADIAWPIRSIFSRQKNVTVSLSKVEDIDKEQRRVICDNREVSYDHLIIASGSSHSYFGKDQWSEYAPGMKQIVDATDVRRKILVAFERAELAETPEDMARELTFVVVGAGPTGVELAGAIGELAHVTLCEDFRRIESKSARIILIEAGPRILAAFPEDLSAKAEASLTQLGVEVKTGTMVQDISDRYVVANGETIPTATTIWAAGVQIEGVGSWLKVETDRAGRVPVADDLTLPGHPEISVIGDAAQVKWQDGTFVPGVAPAAKQEGKFVAKRLKALLDGKSFDERFSYKHMGNLATIGRNSAVIHFGKLKLSGILAWWMWGFVHIYFLIGVRQPLFVAVNWFLSYVFHSKGARLITGLEALRRQGKL